MSFFGRDEVVVRFDQRQLQVIADALSDKASLPILIRIEQKLDKLIAGGGGSAADADLAKVARDSKPILDKVVADLDLATPDN